MDAIDIVRRNCGWALLVATCAASPLAAQRQGQLGYVPGGFRGPMVEPIAYDCPCERPGGVPTRTPSEPFVLEGEGRATDDIPDPAGDPGLPADEYAPEVADLTSDAGFASASQSAAPNMIGDTIGYGGTGYITIGDGLGFSVIPFSPGGGRKFKASTNQSPVPEQRFFYNFHLFEDALAAQGPDGSLEFIDVARNEFGWEWLFLGGMMSAQIQLPFSTSIDSSIQGFDLDAGVGAPDFTDTELGNIAIALKGLLYQTDCDALSLGLAIDLPTAENVLIEDVNAGSGTLSIETDAVTVSPFVGYMYQSNCRWYAQGFLQLAVPLNENEYRLTNLALDPTSTVGKLGEETLLYADAGLGFWFYNSALDGDCCGGHCGGKGGCCDSNGVAGVVEIHYTTSLDDDTITVINEELGDTFTYSDFDWLNLSLGLAAHHNCWSLTPAVVVPMREAPDRQFDVEWTVQINRRY